MKSKPTNRRPAAKGAAAEVLEKPKSAQAQVMAKALAKASGKIPAQAAAAAPEQEARFRNLLAGDPAPMFKQRSATNPRFVFDTVGGRYILLAFIGSTAEPIGAAAAKAFESLVPMFDPARVIGFTVSADPRDETEEKLKAHQPGSNVFWDFDLSVAREYGAAAIEPGAGDGAYRPMWFVLDPTLRILAVFGPPTDEAKLAQIRGFLQNLPAPQLHGGFAYHAPVLYIPRVFEPSLCKALIAHYDKTGGEESGFMRDVNGRTTTVYDPNHKRRRDAQIDDLELMQRARERIRRRVVPEIKKAFQFTVSRIERDIVACYRAEDDAHFRAHRDNTTMGTAHRRFAVSINLNSEFEGGTLSFPEFSPVGYKPAPGGAVVFSCSLLHAAAPVTRGHRYAYLPFLYDDEAAKVREANNSYLDPNVGEYKVAAPGA